jgi:serine/threonine-protein kinase
MLQEPLEGQTLERVGQKIGRYRLTGRLGEGGMGEVYAARDLELDRSVAVKLLNQSTIGTSHMVDRFIREAKAASALNHPNVITIYEVIHSESRLAIIMELVEGTCLRQLCGSPLPVDRVVHLGEQVARALAAAHTRGIVHCDIKPENLVVRPDGIVKVLDFGLARDLASVTAGSLFAAGTLRYMSPEQSRGDMPSAASDIFSLGILIYELATGSHPFDSSSLFEDLKALNQREPHAPSSLNPFVPRHLDDLILRMLSKDPALRPSAAEVGKILGSRFQAETALLPVPSTAVSLNEKTRKLDRNLLRVVATLPWADWKWKVATAIFAGLFVLALWAPRRKDLPLAERPSVRLDLNLGSEVSLGSTIGPAVILSPDGSRLVYVSQDGGTARLFTRRLDQPKAAKMAGTEGAYAPFFSPDGQWVGFFAHGKLKKIRIDGSEPVSVCDAPSGRGASWGDDGNIVAALDQQAGLSEVPPEGGKVVPLTSLNLERGEFTHRWPQILPGSNAVLFSVSVIYGNWNDADIMVVSRKDHKAKNLLVHAGMYPRFVPGGYLMYANKGVLFAVRFDPGSLQVQGSPKLLTEVAANPSIGFAQLDLARNGTLAYKTRQTDELRSVNWLDKSGKAVSLNFEPAAYLFPRLSPDGSRLAYTVRQSSSQNLWIRDLQRGTNTRLTNTQSSNPVWSPDGNFVVFQAHEGMFWARADGAGLPQPLVQNGAIQLPASFTADGTRLAFSELIPGAGAEIRTVPIEHLSGQLHAGTSQPFLKTPTLTTFPAFSPDGRWLAYANSEAGQYEVFVRSFPDNGAQVQISNAGGTMPVWSRNGHDLFYRTADQRIMTVTYTAKGNSFHATKPRVWGTTRLAGIGLGQNFDLAPDGERFLVFLPVENQEAREEQSHVIIATNFSEEIGGRVTALER